WILLCAICRIRSHLCHQASRTHSARSSSVPLPRTRITGIATAARWRKPSPALGDRFRPRRHRQGQHDLQAQIAKVLPVALPGVLPVALPGVLDVALREVLPVALAGVLPVALREVLHAAPREP